MANLIQDIEAQIAGAKATRSSGTSESSARSATASPRSKASATSCSTRCSTSATASRAWPSVSRRRKSASSSSANTRASRRATRSGHGQTAAGPGRQGLLGRVVNTLGEPIDGKGPIASDVAYPVEIAPGIMRRKPVSQPVQTGIMAIDAMIPIGRGQRELIIGDRSTGKTTICVDTIISQARLNRQAEAAGDKDYRPLYSIYVAIGQKQSTIARLIAVLEEAGAMPYTIIVASPAADSATNQAPGAVCRGGHGRVVHGQRHGRAHRLRRSLQAPVAYRRCRSCSSGRRARSLPGRCLLPAQSPARTCRARRRTVWQRFADALPIIETQAGDVSAHIPTNVISITDGQIYLERTCSIRASGRPSRSVCRCRESDRPRRSKP